MAIMISKNVWRENNRWIKNNPNGRLIALFYPSRKYVALIRTLNPNERWDHGFEVKYPNYLDKTIVITGLGNEDGLTINLEWIEE